MGSEQATSKSFEVLAYVFEMNRFQKGRQASNAFQTGREFAIDIGGGRRKKWMETRMREWLRTQCRMLIATMAVPFEGFLLLSLHSF